MELRILSQVPRSVPAGSQGDMNRKPVIWKAVETRAEGTVGTPPESRLMAWAIQLQSRRPVHVQMLSRQQTGLACECECPACGARLEAVNAGRPADYFLQPRARRPFFRHHAGQQRDHCLVSVSRLAALRLLAERDEIDLPAPRSNRELVGASGHVYFGQAIGSPTRSKIIRREWIDEQAAHLTLEDGRTIRVQISTAVQVGDDIAGVITLAIDDPDVATWSATEILDRLKLSDGWLCWGKHWDDAALARQALAQAQSIAAEHCDHFEGTGLELPFGFTPEQRAESVLHWQIKQILAECRTITVGPFRREFRQEQSDGRRLEKVVELPSMRLVLSEVRLEQRLDGFVPDVLCRAVDPSGTLASMELLIEVAVTHHVGDEKLAKIRESGLACIELDAARLGEGGRVTVQKLRNLVRESRSGTQWLHHPEIERRIEQARSDLDEQAAQYQRQIIVTKQRAEWFAGLTRAQAISVFVRTLFARWDGVQTADGAVAELDTDYRLAIDTLSRLGLSHAGDSRLSADRGILWKINSLRRAAVQGNARTCIALLEASFHDAMGDGKRYFSYLLTAFKVYSEAHELSLLGDLQPRLDAVRSTVRASIAAGETTYARPTLYDEVVAVAFPELAAELAKPGGTVAYADRIRMTKIRQHAAAEREAAVHEIAMLASQQQRELREGLSLADTKKWSALGGIPLDLNFCHRALRNSWFGSDGQAKLIVDSAWQARNSGLSVGAFVRMREPISLEEVRSVLRVLETTYLLE